MALNLAPFLRQRFFDANGNPLAGGKLYTYQSGTSIPQATYTDSGGGTPNANPVVMDANGEANVWLDPSLSYKFILKNSLDVTQWTVDSVIGLASANTIATASIVDLAVTTAKLANDSVTAAKLADDASIDANRAVTSDHMRTGAVTIPKLADAAKGLQVLNGGLSASVSGNALTVALKGIDGNNPSSTNPVYVALRNSSATTGTPVIRTVTAALSMTVSSGSTLGHTSSVDGYVYVYLIDNAGTVELAVSGQQLADDLSLVSTTAEGGAGAADSGSTIYSTTARSNVAIKLLGRIKSNQATAGTWASSPTEVSIGSGSPARVKQARVYDTKSSGTDGGTFSNGAWRTRDLNAEDDQDNIVSVASNQFTLGAGTYRVDFNAPAHRVDGHMAKLYNITDAVDVALGGSSFSANTDGSTTSSCGTAHFTISGTKVFEIQHRSTGNFTTKGFGASLTIGPEIYTQVTIMKLSP